MSVIMMRRMHHGSLNNKWSRRYFTLKNVKGNSFYLYLTGCNCFGELKYRQNGGNWTSLNTNSNAHWIQLSDYIEISGIKNKSGSGAFRIQCVSGDGTQSPITDTNLYELHAKGNIMSLLYGDEFLNKTALTQNTHSLTSLFNSNQILTNASKLILPATDLITGCYVLMFSGCKSLIYPPKVLPADTGAFECYRQMFSGCTNLIQTPIIRMTDGSNNGLNYGIQCEKMFEGCTSLTKAEIWFALGGERAGASRPGAAADDMFYNCTNLKELHLYAPKLYHNCYNSIIFGYSTANQLKVYIYAKEADTTLSEGAAANIINAFNVWDRYFGDNWPTCAMSIYMLEGSSTFLNALKTAFNNYRNAQTVYNTLTDGTYSPPNVDLDTGKPI